MTTTIDKAGRMVIPVAIRKRLGFKPGAELEITADVDGVHLRRIVRGPELVSEGGIEYSRPTVPPEELPPLDIERIIDEEREMALVGTLFFDTSVLVAGLATAGNSGEASRQLMFAVGQDRLLGRATAWHCCLEFYAVTTRLPVEYRLSPQRALKLLREQILARFEVFDLPADRRREFVESLDRETVIGGKTYDLHIAEIARSSGAGAVVTGNRRHFTSLLRQGMRVLTPEEALAEI